jgi:hypothetical protein
VPLNAAEFAGGKKPPQVPLSLDSTVLLPMYVLESLRPSSFELRGTYHGGTLMVYPPTVGSQSMEGWERIPPAFCELWEDAALGYTEFTERPVFQPTPEAPSKFRDRATSAAFSPAERIQDIIN